VYPDPLSAQAQSRFSGQGQQGQGSPGGGGGGAYLDSAPRDPETGPACVACVACVSASAVCVTRLWRVCHSSLPWVCFRAPALLCERSRRVLAFMLQMAVSAQLWALCCHTGCFHTATPLRRPESATRAVAICFSTVLSYILCVCM